VWREEDTPENRHRLRQVVLRLRQKLKRSPARHGKLRNHRDQGYEWRLP
jgi:DNA-binding response OmpR family regulator